MILPNPEKYSQSYFRKDLTKFARSRLSQIVDNLHRYNRISDDEFVIAKDALDSFLKSGQGAGPSADFQDLTVDDLESLENEIN